MSAFVIVFVVVRMLVRVCKRLFALKFACDYTKSHPGSWGGDSIVLDKNEPEISYTRLYAFVLCVPPLILWFLYCPEFVCEVNACTQQAHAARPPALSAI
jgi:hypothetical protein